MDICCLCEKSASSGEKSSWATKRSNPLVLKNALLPLDEFSSGAIFHKQMDYLFLPYFFCHRMSFESQSILRGPLISSPNENSLYSDMLSKLSPSVGQRLVCEISLSADHGLFHILSCPMSPRDHNNNNFLLMGSFLPSKHSRNSWVSRRMRVKFSRINHTISAELNSGDFLQKYNAIKAFNTSLNMLEYNYSHYDFIWSTIRQLESLHEGKAYGAKVRNIKFCVGCLSHTHSYPFPRKLCCYG